MARPRLSITGDSVTAGILLGIAAYGVFSVHDAAIKWLVAASPIWQVLFIRSLVIVVVCCAFGRAPLLARARRTPLKRALAARGAITLAAWLCYYTASRSLPFAQMTSIYFAAPIMVTLMAAPLLGEHVTATRWISVAIGFAGVLVAADPRDVAASWPTVLVLTAAALWGYGIILLRQIARRESSLMQMLYTNLFFLLLTGIGTALTWQMPSPGVAALALITGILGGAGQFALFEAVRRAPASVMSTVEYTALLWAFVLGFMIWGDVPAAPIWIGAALIAAAGAVLITTEGRRGAPTELP